MERRSIYSLLSKPVTREQCVIGKYVGLVMTLAVNLAAMVAAFYWCCCTARLTMPLADQHGAGRPGAPTRG